MVPGGGIAKGMWTTLKNFWTPKVTRQYPEERPQMPERWRGRLDLIYDPFGEHKCEVCFQCAQVCPVEAIDMSGFDSRGNRIRYGMPEIYDERKDANAWRRAGQPARPMRNPARWDETIDTPWVDETVDAVRTACPGVQISLSTAAYVEPDPSRRLELVRAWTELPDIVSANVCEDGIVELCDLVLSRGIGIEASRILTSL